MSVLQPADLGRGAAESLALQSHHALLCHLNLFGKRGLARDGGRDWDKGQDGTESVRNVDDRRLCL